MSMEHKSFAFQVKAIDDEQGLIEAYGSVFDVIDDGDGYMCDVVRKGAFARTIKNSKARKNAGKATFLATMLWAHDPQNHLPLGGWYDLSEDEHGLLGKGQIVLDTQLGREVYALIKKQVINQFSIGYDIPSGGATYDSKTGVRELTEIRLWEISPVVFAMNQEALLVSVKSLEAKAVTGNTSGPIGPRDESWDGAKAKRQIWAAAEKEDGSLNAALAKKYFMVCDGDAQQKGSYGYPFWYVGSSPHICVGAVKAIAAAIQGARGANAPDGLKAKVETLYGRINRKYPDDPELVPPWKEGGKGSIPPQKKSFEEHLQEEMCEDLLEDFQDVLVCALCCAVMDAFKAGEQPEADIRAALSAFGDAVIAWTAQAIECNLSEFLDGAMGDWSPYDYTIRNGSRSYMGMAASRPLGRKAGRTISAATASTIQEHIDALHGIADDHMKATKAHVKAIHSAADGMAGMLPATDGGGQDESEDDQQPAKNAAPFSRTRRAAARPEASTVTDEEIATALGTIRQLRQSI